MSPIIPLYFILLFLTPLLTTAVLYCDNTAGANICSNKIPLVNIVFFVGGILPLYDVMSVVCNRHMLGRFMRIRPSQGILGALQGIWYNFLCCKLQESKQKQQRITRYTEANFRTGVLFVGVSSTNRLVLC